MGPKYEHAGWLLSRIAVQLDPKAKKIAGTERPNPYVRVTDPTNHALDMRTATQRDTLAATWAPAWFLPEGTKFSLGVWQHNVIFSDKSLGGRQLSSTRDPPPPRLEADIPAAVYWSASLEWLSVHY